MQSRETSREDVKGGKGEGKHVLRTFDCPLAAKEGRLLSGVSSLLSTGKGLTLVEVMIAFLVLLVTSLALMQTALVSISANMQNVLRDEAVSVAEMRFAEAKSAPFDDVDQDSHPDSNPLTISNTIFRTLKNVSQQRFDTTMTVSQLSTDIKRVDVTVTWSWKGVSYTHSASTIMRRPT